MGIKLKHVVTVLLSVFLGVSVSVQAENVQDDAGFFSQDTITAANNTFSAIETNSHLKTLLITFTEIPADHQDQFQKLGKEAFYNAWSLEMLHARKLDAVMLMTKSPRRLQIATSSACEKQMMTPAQRDQLRDAMLKEFKVDHYDQGLNAGLVMLKGYSERIK